MLFADNFNDSYDVQLMLLIIIRTVLGEVCFVFIYYFFYDLQYIIFLNTLYTNQSLMLLFASQLYKFTPCKFANKVVARD